MLAYIFVFSISYVLEATILYGLLYPPANVPWSALLLWAEPRRLLVNFNLVSLLKKDLAKECIHHLPETPVIQNWGKTRKKTVLDQEKKEVAVTGSDKT